MVLVKYISFTTIFTIFSFFWASKIFFVVESDFWQYIVGAYYLDSSNILYTDHWDNKGPFFYFYIKFLLNFLGGKFFAIISLILISLIIYIIPFIFILKKIKKNFYIQTLFFFIFLALLFSQSYHSIPYFLSSTLKFYFLVFAYESFLKNDNFIKNFSLTLLFFWLSFFTLVDTILLFPIILLILLKYFFYNKANRDTLKILSIFFLIPFSIYTFFKLYFNYDLSSFLNSNFIFNSWATENYYGKYFTAYKINFNKLELFSNLLRSGILILFLIFFIHKLKNLKQYLKYFSLSKISKIIKHEMVFVDLVIIINIILFLILRVDKTVYVFLFFPSILFLVFNYFVRFKIKIDKAVIITLILISGFTIFLEMGKNISKVAKNINCISTSFCKSSEYQKFEIIINNRRENQEILIVGKGTGYPNYFFDEKPNYSIINEWLYFDDNYINKAFLSFHKNLLNKSKGFRFWIDEEILSLYGIGRNVFLNEILNNSRLLIKDNHYSMYEIK